MARYEGMDEILQRVRQRLQEPAPVGNDLLPAAEPPPGTVARQEQQFVRVMDVAGMLQRQAETFSELLSPEYVRSLTDGQQQHLLAALGAVLHELWGVEDVLQRTTTSE
jgi:hypothetical protein